MFKDSAIILDAIWQSFLTKSAIAAMFTSVQVDFGRPPLINIFYQLPSISKSRIPPKNVWYVQSLIPISLCTKASVSVVDRSALKQNFMATPFISTIQNI